MRSCANRLFIFLVSLVVNFLFRLRVVNQAS